METSWPLQNNSKNLGVKNVLGIKLVEWRCMRTAVIRGGLRLFDFGKPLKNDRFPIWDEYGNIRLEGESLNDDVRFFFHFNNLVVATTVFSGFGCATRFFSIGLVTFNIGNGINRRNSGDLATAIMHVEGQSDIGNQYQQSQQ